MVYNRLMTFNWQQDDWKNFTHDPHVIEDALIVFANHVGRSDGLLEGLAEETRTDALIEIMIAEAIKTSVIEGEYLSRQDVMSSIRNNLGIAGENEHVGDKRAQGAADLMVAVRKHYDAPLSEDMLFEWHKMLMSGNSGVKVGAWRTHSEAMQVVSGPIGRQKIHFEAPPSSDVPAEMTEFFAWFNGTAPDGNNPITKPVIRSAIAHIYFETIHPFEDGNGRIGRAISEKALSQGLARPVLLSLSKTIEANRNAYYDALKAAQRSNEITPWIVFFADICVRAQIDAEAQIEFTLKKTKFLDRHKGNLNARQLKVVDRMLEEGPAGFEGGMSAKKYISITKTSKATATRDLQDLAAKGVVVSEGAGRNVRHHINL